MIHPSTRVAFVSPAIGLGVVATAPIPKGSLVVVRDAHDLTFDEATFRRLHETIRHAMETYMYRDREGRLILSWDHARFMNHRCDANSLMTAYGVEVAIRDIGAGEEMTTDYGLLNVLEPYPIHCGCDGCREALRLDDIDRYADVWDEAIKEALALVDAVEQPLRGVAELAELRRYLDGNEEYRSVSTLTFRPAGSSPDSC